MADVQENIEQKKLSPRLAVILIGSDEASQIYVDLKGKAARKIGIGFQRIEMGEHITEKEVLDKIQELNAAEKISGIIVQLPIPEHLDKNKIIQSIAPGKDVDGFHQQKTFAPVFPHALWELLQSAGEDLPDKQAVIVCNSAEFGQSMQEILGRKGVRAQYVFRFQIPEKLEAIKQADIIITACGQQNLIGARMVKSGVIIIDGGIVRVDGQVRGDVDSDSLRDFPGYLSPVPGGVGPVTIACLLRNVYLAVKKSSH